MTLPLLLSLGSSPDRTLAQEKTILFKVYTAAGVALRTWPDVAGLPSFRWPINGGPGAMTLRLPRAWGHAGEPGEPGSLEDLYFGNVVKIYVFDSETGTEGALVYQGVIEDYTHDLRGELVSVTLAPVTADLHDQVILAQITYTADPTTMIGLAEADGYLGPTIAPDPANPLVGQTYAATFGPNEKVSGMLERIQRLAGGRWYWRLEPDGELVFNEYPKNVAAHVFHIGKEVAADVQLRRSRLDLKQRVIVTGADGVEGIATAAGYDPSTAPRDLHYANQKITDGPTASRIATSLLDFYSEPTYESQCTVIDNTYDPEHGYDIESLRPGDTVSLVNPTNVFAFNVWGDDHTWGDGSTWGGTWREQSQKPLVIAEIEYGFYWARLTLHNRPNSVPEQLANLNDRLLLTGG